MQNSARADLPLCCVGHAAGLPPTLYLGEAGSDVRLVKLLELGFALGQKHEALVLRRASRSPESGGNEGNAGNPAGDSNTCTESVADVVEGDFAACDSLQHALAVAAFSQWHRCSGVSDADRKWRKYIDGLRKELASNRTQWGELQALFTVELVGHDSTPQF